MGKEPYGQAPGDTRAGIRGGKLPGTVGRHRQVRMELKVLYMHFYSEYEVLGLRRETDRSKEMPRGLRENLDAGFAGASAEFY